MNYELLISFVFATAALAISPGPDNIYVLMQSIVHGKKFGLATVAGLISGCLIHTSLVAFGVSAIIKENDTIFFIIKLFGALYLLFLAYKVFRSEGRLDLGSQELPKKSLWQLFKQGFIMNVLNPKVSIFFLAFFPSFLFSDSLSTVIQFYVLGLLFMFVSTLIFSAVAILAGYISEYTKQHSQVGIYFKWLQIVVFVGIAIFIFIAEK
ncbi:LysE family translocator [Psychroserpens sp.]|uniref:LysE family translocator n=1 Tax=Psychroserpens sp. TaxID=2020870 RepID=UPI001B111D19|nr:LysE family translocator [Psychroserpens sp.]MBO6607212.1 LysE family translocator [Psychroserpens sp.]MBO6632003.1 LysE family translocator [Psychroserpens sp.]MBO6654358.1 LysE family translocator [Psychroserpens sp.]MBO6682356.1 LysE family translocator [Psychroserpens sp.]MBO6750984.1 LysE family translocator [Psychroserpens sp.]